MRIGTKSILFGAHAFYLHPLIVALAWWKLYGFPWDPRLWIAFIVHDLGYAGKPNMDGPEGEEHVRLGGRLLGVFGCEWSEFSLRHSRYWCRKHGREPSRLCYADKLAISLTPAWIYLPMARATGELREYRSARENITNDPTCDEETEAALVHGDDRLWWSSVQDYCRRFALEHAHSGGDRWTGRRGHWSEKE